MNLRIPTALLAVALALPTTAAAQRGLEVRITPQFGLLTPAEWFYYEVTALGEGPMEWTEAAVLRTSMVGLTAQAALAGSGLWVRGTVLRTLDTDTYLAYAVLNAGPFTPPSVVRTPYRLPTDITLASIDLAFPTRIRLPLGIQPYFIVGAGGKHYTFDRGPLAAAPGVVAPEDGTTLMANLGAGLAVRVMRVNLDVQVRDAISEYWGERQHDVAWIVGLSWRLF